MIDPPLLRISANPDAARGLSDDDVTSVVVPAGRDLADVRRTVASVLRASRGHAVEIILVSPRPIPGIAGDIGTAARSSVSLRLLRGRGSPERLCHLGARAARGSRLVFVRAGHRVRGTSQWRAIQAALADPRVGLVGVERPRLPRRGPPRWQPPAETHHRFTPGPVGERLVGLRAEAFREVGGLARGRGFRALQRRLLRASYRLAAVAGSRLIAVPGREGRHFLQHRDPVISVAIATRNYGRWLPRCLGSILRATNPTGAPIQIVVADDASTDDTAAILDEWRRRHPRSLSVVRLRASTGVAAAKNAAIARAIGEFVALHDADDEFHPAKLARCHAALRGRSRPELVTHDYVFVDDATGRRTVSGPEWSGGWRPPGVWVFRHGAVTFNAQMVSGYEELEWSKRCWHRRRRAHVDAPLAIVHGTSVVDQWKLDRRIAGVASMTRWDRPSRRGEATAFACRGCGNQYLRPRRCCGREALVVPLVCFMAVAGAPDATPPATSVIVAAGDRIGQVRRILAAAARRPEARDAEWVFVHCHPRRSLVRHLRALSRRRRVKAVFTPPGHPLVYSHDVNRGVRAAAGRDLLVVGPLTWAIQREAFWALGALPERARTAEAGVGALRARARAEGYPVTPTRRRT